MADISSSTVIEQRVKYMVADSCHFVFPWRKTPREKTKRRKNAMRKKRKDEKNALRKDEITPCEKTKLATRKDEILARKDEKTPCEMTPFETLIFSSFRVASFCLLAWRLFVFSLALFCLVVITHGVFSFFRGEKTPCKKTKRQTNAVQKDEKKI